MIKKAILNKDFLFVLVIITLCLVFLRNFLPFNKDILMGAYLSDGVDLLIAHSLSSDCLRNHIIPFWNPYLFCGLPALAEPQNAVFYPLNLIFLILPINIAFNYSIILHLILAGIFMYYFSKMLQLENFASLCVAITFIFSSIFTLPIFMGHLNNIYTMAWIPLLFLLTEKFLKTKKIYFIILGGIALSMQIFSGHVQIAAYTILAIGFYLLFKFISQPQDRPRIFKAGLYLISLGLALSAIQLLPTLEFVKNTTRAMKHYAFFSSFSFAPENLITMIVPEFFGSSLNETYEYWGRWLFQEECLYMGIFPLISAIIALRFYKKNSYVRFFGLFSLLSIIIALAYYIPILKNILIYLPVITLLRAQSKFKLFTVFSLSILSGFGINALFDNRQNIKLEKKQILYTYILICLFAAIIFAIKLRFDFWAGLWFKIITSLLSLQDRFYIYDYRQPGFIVITFLNAYIGVQKFILFLAISLTLIVILTNKKIKSGFIKFLFLLFIIIDLWSFSAKYMKVLKLSDVLWSEEAVEILKNDDTLHRIIHFVEIPNISALYKEQSLNGSASLQLKNYDDFVAIAQKVFHDNKDSILYFYPNSKPLDLAGFKYLILSLKSKLGLKGCDLVFSDNKIKIYKNPNVLPRAFMVFKAKNFDNRKDVITEFKSKNFDPEEYVILETTDGNKTIEKTRYRKYSVRITKYAPNEVILSVETSSDGYLFLSDVYYPAWKVFVDGKLDKIYKANIAFRAVYLKKGKHIVRFIYDSFSFKIGLAISLTTLLFLIILFPFLYIKSKIRT